MITTTIFAFITFLFCVLLHYEVLIWMSRFMPVGGRVFRSTFLLLMTAIVATHIVEIWIYAGVLSLLESQLGIGHMAGEFNGHFFDYVYFSAVTYTSLGLGDVWPHGPLRLITGIEALNGLTLIGWSVWFTYPIIRRGCQQARRQD